MRNYLYIMKNGKKIYCRKPDLYNLDEKTARKYYDAIISSEPSAEIEKRLRKRIAEEDKLLRKSRIKGFFLLTFFANRVQ